MQNLQSFHGAEGRWRSLLTKALPHLRRALVILCIVIVIAQLVRLCISERGDFNLHWIIGLRMLNGRYIYLHGTDCPYPPFWAVAHTPLAMMSRLKAQVVLYPLFVVSFLMLCRILRRLTEPFAPLSREQSFWAMALAVLCACRFLIRDMPECGVNLALVALCWGAVSLWMQGRDRLSGMTLGFAAALKCTPAAFIAYFVWKRQWKVAGTAILTTAVLFLTPLMFLKPAEFVHTYGYWLETASNGINEPDPSRGVLGEEPVQNDSLRPAMARYLMVYPATHKARINHPWSVDFGNLDPVTAGRVIKVVMLLLAFGVAFQFRHRVTDRKDPALLWECAALSVAMLLYSPITWGQHCVGVFPAFYLISRTLFAQYSANAQTVTSSSPFRLRIPRVTVPYLAVYLFVTLILNRAIVGQTGSHVIDTYHLHTWLFLGLLLLLVAFARSERAAAATEEPLLLPFQAKHQAVQPAADPKQRYAISG